MIVARTEIEPGVELVIAKRPSRSGVMYVLEHADGRREEIDRARGDQLLAEARARDPAEQRAAAWRREQELAIEWERDQERRRQELKRLLKAPVRRSRSRYLW